MLEPHERLEAAMEARRLDLGMSWVDVARAAKISPQALRSIRRGEYRPSRLTARALDGALKWGPGSVEEVLASEEAIAPRAATGTAREIRQEKVALARQALQEARAESGQPPADDVDEYRLEERIARIRRMLDKSGDIESAAELDLMLRLYEERDAG